MLDATVETEPQRKGYRARMILGTTNPHKVREIGGICAPLGIALEPIALDVPEEGETFEENALAKAIGYGTARPGQTVLVEDSGLEIPALGGLPGPWSARFDDFDLDTRTVRTHSARDREEIDAANRKRVLALMKDVPAHRRAASFVVSVVVARRGAVLFTVTRRAAGWILEEERGEHGFGYDAIFASDASFGKSWAEIDAARKDLISHRGEALWDLQAWLCSDAARDVS
jgi:XTP/dITP diphosphohydrolase